jgi:K+-transporting ATPase ATPase C chain
MIDPRIYRAGLVPAFFALIVAAFAVQRPPTPVSASLPPDSFEATRAFSGLRELASTFPRRRPGSPGDRALARRVAGVLRDTGFRVRTRRFDGGTALGERSLETVIGSRPGLSSREIVVVAHRDSLRAPGTAELSGTAALLELARIYEGRTLRKTLVLVSTSGGTGPPCSYRNEGIPMNLARQGFNAIMATIVLTLIVGVLYPLAMTGLSQVLFRDQANGSLIRSGDGTIVGSSLLGQNFTGAQYFHPRPSVAGSDGYDASASGGSNLGPTNQKLFDAVKDRAVAYRQENGLAVDAPVPVDAVTASASGLDPDITPANAALQVPRVAKAHNMSEADLRALVARYTEGRTLGFLGEDRINVLELNLALDGTAR